MRGEWIEIGLRNRPLFARFVSPREGRVDWNCVNCLCSFFFCVVSPREGRVDWNYPRRSWGIRTKASLPVRGEWIEIDQYTIRLQGTSRSLPGWGEWVEIKRAAKAKASRRVSPRMGRVGWNNNFANNSNSHLSVSPRMGRVGWNRLRYGLRSTKGVSLPGWGEWVEIGMRIVISKFLVSLSPDGESGLKWRIHCAVSTVYSLSPDGESGLK